MIRHSPGASCTLSHPSCSCVLLARQEIRSAVFRVGRDRVAVICGCLKSIFPITATAFASSLRPGERKHLMPLCSSSILNVSGLRIGHDRAVLLPDGQDIGDQLRELFRAQPVVAVLAEQRQRFGRELLQILRREIEPGVDRESLRKFEAGVDERNGGQESSSRRRPTGRTARPPGRAAARGVLWFSGVAKNGIGNPSYARCSANRRIRSG